MHNYDIEILDYLKLIADSIRESRNPIDFTVQISSVIPWTIDYHNRKHLYIWSGNNKELSLDDYGIQSVPAGQWVPFDFPEGTKVLNTSTNTLIPLFVKATDEAWPIFSEHADVAIISSVTVPIVPQASSTSSLTSVVAATSSTPLLAANSIRLGYSVFNDSTSIMYLAESGTASTTAYTTQVPPNSLWESPTFPLWTGAVSAIWASATGNARITEKS